jgi:LacI family transcriptional regulator
LTRIRDIAEKAGVSATTVSHVLNKSRHVHPDTVARVLQAVEDLHYKPNMLARSLRRRQTNTIGLLVSDIENPYFAEIASAVETAAYERDYSLILCNTAESIEKEICYVEVLFGKQVDGLILAPAPGDHAYLAHYLARGERVVVINRHVPDIAAPVVLGDDEQSFFALASRFLAAGHRFLGAIVGLESVRTTADRLRGLERAMAAYGLSLVDAWLYPGQARPAGGRAAAQAFIGLESRPTCVLSFNSVMHDGFLLGLTELAPHLLNDVETGSLGCSPLVRQCATARYCLEVPSYRVGQIAANLLLDVLSGVAAWHTDRIIVENTLVELHRHRPGSPPDERILAVPGGESSILAVV